MSRLHEPVVAPGPEDEAGAAWRARSLSVRVGAEWTTLRLVRFARAWIASADTLEGPTIGLDASPYLAAQRALEPLAVPLASAMALVGEVTAGRARSSRPESAE